jgi:hypothetical protein
MNALKFCTAFFVVGPGFIGCSVPLPPMNTDLAAQSCVIVASISHNQLAKVITSVGSVTCDYMADLVLKVCLYAKAPTEMSWGVPLICRMASASSVLALTAQAEVGLGGATATEYKTVVDVDMNGVAQAPKTSAVVTVP